MGLCVSGVSGGVPVGTTPAAPTVQPLLGGVTLTQAGDFAQIFVNNGASPGGPDVSGLFAISGGYTGANLVVRFVPDVTNWQTGNWQVFNSVLRNDTNSFLTGPFQLTNGAALQLSLINVASLFAVQVYLLAPLASGSLLVSGNTNPGSVVGVDSAILAALLASNALNKAEVLALSDLGGADYLGLVGGTY